MTAARERIAVFSLLVLYWLLAVSASIHKSNVYDEVPHIIGGYSYLHTGDYRLHPENGVLPQKFAALPLLFLNVQFPSLQQEAWWHADLWRFGFQFLFLSGNEADQILFAERSMIAILGMALGLVIFLCSHQLFGVRAAFLSLVLFVFCPTMLAHGALVTSDISSALFLLLSVWSFWNWLNEWRWQWWLLTIISFAGLMLSKSTWVFLFALVPLLLLVRFAFRKERLPAWSKILLSAAGIVISVYLLIWSFYSFRYSALCGAEPGRDRFLFTWQQVEAHAAGPMIEFARTHHLLPEAFLYGNSQTVAALKRHFRLAFLNGEFSLFGWWYFFPYAFLVKTPLPLIAILILAALQWSRSGTSFYRTAPLWILLSVYWAFALTSEVDIGHRYILPIYPPLFIIAGSAASVLDRKSRTPKILLALALVWFVFESFWIRPNYLAYFNELSGGPSNGYKHLVDSSLDWGQDLPGLQSWLETNRNDATPVYLSYFGTSSPEYYGIDAIQLHNADVSHGTVPELHAGIYCIGATMLQCMYNIPAIGPWALPYEVEYQKLLQAVRSNSANQATLDRFQRYRFARLAAFLRKRAYDAQIGHSILIYRLSEAEISKALNGRPAELQDKIEVRGTIDGSIPPFL
jgi:Dolichyl-phosphate-mannose-protein mannosyltransferase